MHPILLRIPLPGGRHFDIATYGFMMALGTLAGILTAWRIAKRESVKGDVIIDVGFWAVICGIFGAKLWFVVEYWGTFANKWDLLWNFRSGLVYYGGVLGGALGVFIYLKAKRLPILKILDILAPAAALGLALGRVGCLMNGCCYGIRTDSWLGVCFKPGSPAFDDQLHSGLRTISDTASLPLYPTQAFSSVGALLVFFALLGLRRLRRFYGEQIFLLFMLYPPVRFSIEFIRGDHTPVLLGMTPAQVFSVSAFALAAVSLVYLRTARPPALQVCSLETDVPPTGRTNPTRKG